MLRNERKCDSQKVETLNVIETANNIEDKTLIVNFLFGRICVKKFLNIEGTVMQIVKAQINDHLLLLKVT